MQEMGLIARVTRVTYRAAGMRRFLASGENLRSDGAVPDEKNTVWVADVTYDSSVLFLISARLI